MAYVTSKPTVELPDDYRPPEKPNGQRLTELEKTRKDLRDARERKKKLAERQRLKEKGLEYKFTNPGDAPIAGPTNEANYQFDDKNCYWIASCPRREQRMVWDEVTRGWINLDFFHQSIQDPLERPRGVDRPPTVIQRLKTFFSGLGKRAEVEDVR